MTTPVITLDSQIQLRPLSKQLENGVAVIGWRGEFLELPPEGLTFLAWLDEGLSLAEARQRFEAQFNPFPEEDVLEVMNAFLESDFIAAVDDQTILSHQPAIQNDADWIPQSWAQRLFSSPMLLGWLAVVIPAIALWVDTPALWPYYRDFFWVEYNFIIILVGLLLWLVTMFLHELAHLLAARAKGVEATITWTQRLGFIPMSQTVMHTIWAIPRTSRFLPLVAGMMFDILQISLILYALLAHLHGLWVLPGLLVSFLKFYLLTAVMALTAQFWLFSKMDGYFLLSSLLGQRNLQSDTYQWLKAKVRPANEFDPPAAGMKFIYIYAAITVIWGGLFIGQFLLIEIPIRLTLIWESLIKIGAGVSLSPINFADGVAVLTSQGIDIGLLIYAYWRDTLPSLR